MDLLSGFRELWAVDFEFTAPPGHQPKPLCVVARELRSGLIKRQWLGDDPPEVPPYPIDSGSLFVAYYATAEIGCHLALNWPIPSRVLDLFVEFRNLTNGRTPPHGNGLLGALAYFGLDALDANEKDSMRELAMRGGSYSDSERKALMDYCQTDVDALAKLLPKMIPVIDLLRAILRGRYMVAAARMESNGVPIDIETLELLGENWNPIKGRLIREIDRDYGVYIPVGRESLNESDYDRPLRFSSSRWEDYLKRKRIPWPRLPSGSLALDDDTFRELMKAYPPRSLPSENFDIRLVRCD